MYSESAQIKNQPINLQLVLEGNTDLSNPCNYFMSFTRPHSMTDAAWLLMYFLILHVHTPLKSVFLQKVSFQKWLITV